MNIETLDISRREAFSEDPSDRFRALERFLKLELAMVTWVRRQMMKQQPPPVHLRYSCTEEFVLFNGVSRATFITDCAFPPMKLGNCFANAMQLTLENPELLYTEGWACMEQSIPTHHGWVTHPDGSISDPTWLSLVTQDDGRERLPDYRARCVYMGVTIPVDNHLAWFAEHETPNLLAFGEMMPQQVLEHGAGAFADTVSPDERDWHIEEVLGVLRSTPQWKLSADGSSYERVLKDGTVQRWCGQGKYMG